MSPLSSFTAALAGKTFSPIGVSLHAPRGIQRPQHGSKVKNSFLIGVFLIPVKFLNFKHFLGASIQHLIMLISSANVVVIIPAVATMSRLSPIHLILSQSENKKGKNIDIPNINHPKQITNNVKKFPLNNIPEVLIR